MKRRNKNLQTDISFISLVILIFIYFIFLIYQEEYLMDNFLIALVVFIIILITYFTNLTTGLIINTTLILSYITYLIIQSIVKGSVIQSYVYFWIFMSPALTTVFSLFTMNTSALQKQVDELSQKLITISTLNEDTKLKNLRAFENDARIFMSIAKRYDADFGVLVIKFKHQRELERLSRKEGMKKIVNLVASVIRKATRAEDELYLLDDEEILFGVILLTKKESIKVIHDRLKEDIGVIDTNEVLNTRQLILDMRIGMAFGDGKKDALELLDAAKESMQYDVS